MFSFWIYVGGKLIYKLVDNFSVQLIRLKRRREEKELRFKTCENDSILSYTYMMEALHSFYL